MVLHVTIKYLVYWKQMSSESWAGAKVLVQNY